MTTTNAKPTTVLERHEALATLMGYDGADLKEIRTLVADVRTLRARCERLEAALREMLRVHAGPVGENVWSAAHETARAALAGEGK